MSDTAKTGVDFKYSAWIEAQNDDFQENGHYYHIGKEETGYVIKKFLIRRGLLVGIKSAWPLCRLIQSTIVIENGLHVGAFPINGSTMTINPAITSSGQQGLVVRDWVLNKEDPTGYRLDLYIPEVVNGKDAEITTVTKPNLFISYSHRDEEFCQKLRVVLQKLVRQEIIGTWYDRQIIPGSDINPEIESNLRASSIILFLVSPDFLASDYCMNMEVKIGMELQKAGKSRCIPIILRPCEWMDEPFGNLLALPQDGRPITEWDNQDSAYHNMFNGIRKALMAL